MMTGRLPKSEEDITKHIPDLWKYAHLLCGDQESANDLLYTTIEQAVESQSNRSDETPMYAWLTRMMYRQFLKLGGEGRLHRHEKMGLPKVFVLPELPEAIREQQPTSVH